MPGVLLHTLPLPADTERAGRAAFAADNPFLLIGDHLDELGRHPDLPHGSSPSACDSSILLTNVLVTILQSAEDLTDRQAAEATRTRIDWKYALHLPLNYAGLHPERLSDFRGRVSSSPELRRLGDAILLKVKALGHTLPGLSSVHDFNAAVERAACRDCVADACEAMCQTVEALAADEPQWLRDHGLPHWVERYANAERAHIPGSQSARLSWLTETVSDMDYVLRSLSGRGAAHGAALAALETLRRTRDQVVASSAVWPGADPV